MTSAPARIGTQRETATPAPERRKPVHEQVLSRLRQGLMVGVFAPGQVMSLRKLAAAFGTSPMPIRNALGQLVAANALEEMPNRSVRVPRFTRERLNDLFEAREMIEGLAARKACRNATPALLRDLEAINRDLKEQIAKRDITAALAANLRFHFTLYHASRSMVLMPLIESLWLQCGPTLFCTFIAPDMKWDASAHAEVLDGLREEGPATVQRAIVRDIRTTGRHLLAHRTFRFPGGAAMVGDIDLPPEISLPTGTGLA